MGCFGYICKSCGKSIRRGEVCVLKHVRHGKILGKCVGHYNSYGSVEEECKDLGYGGKTGINSRDEICKSEFELEDAGTNSGVMAWHKKCHEKISISEEKNIILSKSDPDRSYGKPRKQFL